MLNKKISKKLLGLEFKLDNDIKLKTTTFIANKILPNCKLSFNVMIV